jgi:hypothetical protein
VTCRAVSRQRLGKHVPAATDTRATIEILLERMFCTRFVPSSYKNDKFGNQVSSIQEFVKKSMTAKLSIKSQPVKRRLGGWSEMAVSLGVSQL